MVWEDRAPVGNNDIFFSFSHDSGQTFRTPPDNISNSTGRSENPQISSTTEIQQQQTQTTFLLLSVTTTMMIL